MTMNPATVERNIRGIADMLTQQQSQISTLENKMKSMDNEMFRLRAELETYKQLSAHVVGRGLGSTVHN